jgi:hypothetical protein
MRHRHTAELVIATATLLAFASVLFALLRS